MNSLHQKYIDQGETIYIGRVDSVMAFPGNERVKLTWMNNSDPRIARTVIYWNNNTDSTEVNINRTQSGIMELEHIFNIPEGAYELNVVNKDIDGNRSLSASKSVLIFGPKYISTLNNRSMKKFVFDYDILTIDWGNVESELIQYTTISFTDYSDPENPIRNTVRVENSDVQTVIPNLRADDQFLVSTTILPEGSIDRMDALPQEYTLVPVFHEPEDPVSDYPYMWVVNVDDDPDKYLLGYYQYMERTSAYTYFTKFYAPANNTRVAFVPQQSLTGDYIGISPLTGNIINKKGTVLPLVLPQQGYYEIAIDLENKTYGISNYTPSTPAYTGLIYIVGDYFGWDDNYPMTPINHFLQTAEYSITSSSLSYYYYKTENWGNIYRARHLPGSNDYHASPSTYCGVLSGGNPVDEDRKIGITFQGAGNYTFTFDKETLWTTISTKH
jgi:hypothetical protein